jgi:hypothetical protein
VVRNGCDVLKGTEYQAGIEALWTANLHTALMKYVIRSSKSVKECCLFSSHFSSSGGAP